MGLRRVSFVAEAFTVVQWDQRGSGRTCGKNGPSLAPTITIERMAQDGVELAELLLKTLQKNKIILVGHSWGSILGVFMVKARPDSSTHLSARGRSRTRRETTPWPTTSFSRRRRGSESSAPSGSSEKWAIRRTGWPGLCGPTEVVKPVRGRGFLHLIHVRPGALCARLLAARRQRLGRRAKPERERLIPQTNALDPKKLGGNSPCRSS